MINLLCQLQTIISRILAGWWMVQTHGSSCILAFDLIHLINFLIISGLTLCLTLVKICAQNHCLLFRGPLMGSNTLWTWILDILTTKYAGCQDRPISVDHSWTKIFCYRSELLTYKLSHSTNSLCMYVYFWDEMAHQLADLRPWYILI